MKRITGTVVQHEEGMDNVIDYLRRESDVEPLIYRRKTDTELLQELLKCLTGTVPLRGIKTLGPFFVSMFMANISEDVRMSTTIINAVEGTGSIIFNSPLFYLPTVVGEKIDAGTPEEVGREAQIAWVIAVVWSLPQYFIMANLYSLLIALKQEETVARLSQDFFYIYLIPTTILSLQSASDQLSQGSKNIYPPVISQLISWSLCGFFAYGFSFGTFGLPALGVRGPAWALTGRAILNFLGYSGYIVRSSSQPNGRFSQYHLFDKFDTYRRSFIRQALNGAVMFVGSVSMVGATFFVNIMAGRFGGTALASQLVISQYTEIAIVASSGIGSAAQIVISNSKERHPENIFRYGNLAAGVGTILPLIYVLFSLIAPKVLMRPFINPYLESNAPEVNVLVDRHLLLISGATSIFNSLQMIIGQALMGKDRVLLPLSLGIWCNWIGALVGYFAADDIVGLNLAVGLGQCLAFLISFIYWFYDHYHSAAEMAIRRNTTASSYVELEQPRDESAFTRAISCCTSLFNCSKKSTGTQSLADPLLADEDKKPSDLSVNRI